MGRRWLGRVLLRLQLGSKERVGEKQRKGNPLVKASAEEGE